MQPEVRNPEFRIVLNAFEGPFDLLLFFIERDELDIYDIPIAQITDEFLAYIDECERLDISLASEFILVAAKLIRIKAKMLLPRKEKNEVGEEIDPREELIQKLLEYKQFKETMDSFSDLESDQIKRLPRGNQRQDIQSIAQKALVDLELESLTLTSLFKTYRRLLLEVQRRESQIVHRIVQYPYTIKSQRSYILGKVNVHGRTSFENLFSGMTERMEAIVTFLALLEMLNQHKIAIQNGLEINSFWIVPAEQFNEEE